MKYGYWQSLLVAACAGVLGCAEIETPSDDLYDTESRGSGTDDDSDSGLSNDSLPDSLTESDSSTLSGGEESETSASDTTNQTLDTESDTPSQSATGEDSASQTAATEDSASQTASDSDSNSGSGGFVAPLVSYESSGQRQLVIANNPQQLTTAELGDADAGDTVVLRASLEGPSTIVLWHENRCGVTIRHGIQLYNDGGSAVSVKILGQSFLLGVDPAAALASMWEAATDTPSTQTVGAGQVLWVLDTGLEVPNGSAFSGAIALDIEGSGIIVNHIAYTGTKTKLDGSRSYVGYVQRVEADGTREAKHYKGKVASSSVVADNVSFSFDDTVAAGPLPVRRATFDLEAHGYNPVTEANSWIVATTPQGNPLAVASDMLEVQMPGYATTLSALFASDGAGEIPQLNNIGAIYELAGTLDNQGLSTRTVTVELGPAGAGGAAIAYETAGGWVSAEIDEGSVVSLGDFVVPAGESIPYGAVFVPGAVPQGGLEMRVVLAD